MKLDPPDTESDILPTRSRLGHTRTQTFQLEYLELHSFTKDPSHTGERHSRFPKMGDHLSRSFKNIGHRCFRERKQRPLVISLHLILKIRN